jgi:hypothetical protein
MAAEGGRDVGGEGRGEPVGDRAALVAQPVDGAEHRLPAVVLGHSGRGSLVQPGAFLQHQGGVDPGRDLDPGVMAPGGDGVAPRLDRVRPAAGRGGGDLGAPAVGAGGEFAQGGPWPRPSGRVAEDDIGADGVVALPEHGGTDLEGLAHDRLGGAAAAVDQRTDIQNGNTTDHRIT